MFVIAAGSAIILRLTPISLLTLPLARRIALPMRNILPLLSLHLLIGPWPEVTVH